MGKVAGAGQEQEQAQEQHNQRILRILSKHSEKFYKVKEEFDRLGIRNVALINSFFIGIANSEGGGWLLR